MKKILSLFVVFSLLLVSCTSNTIYKAPKDLIPKDTMKMVIEDLFVAYAAKNIKNKNNQRNIQYQPLVAEKYNIDSTRFSKSNIYYTSKIDEYQAILKEVQSSLTEKRKVLLEEKRKLDSIKKVEKRALVKATRDSLMLKNQR